MARKLKITITTSEGSAYHKDSLKKYLNDFIIIATRHKQIGGSSTYEIDGEPRPSSITYSMDDQGDFID